MVTSFWDLVWSDPVATSDLSSWASCGGRMSVDFRSKLGIPTGAGGEASEGRGRLGSGPMADPRTGELVVIFAVASLASLVAWELDHEVLSALFAAAAGVAFAMTPAE